MSTSVTLKKGVITQKFNPAVAKYLLARGWEEAKEPRAAKPAAKKPIKQPTKPRGK